MVFAEIIWWISLVVLSVYHLVVFRRKAQHAIGAVQREDRGVSVLIAVKNGSKVLLQHLQRFCEQDYPLYEILIVDDHSSLEERNMLSTGVEGKEKVRLIYSEAKPGKKQALRIGIKKAKYDLILCTDADCSPTSSGWINAMVQHSEGSEMVIGYSPYEKHQGLLNRFIRFETVMTGIQYLSWAMIGKPYMGVGRNLLYHKSDFLKEDPYQDDSLPYGDDDLWVQKAVANARVKVCFKRSSHVTSLPETSWKGWCRQKHRHLSAGHHYDAKAWLRPAGYGMALTLHWLLFFLFVSNGINVWVLSFFLLGLLLRWQTYIQWTRTLGDRDTNLWFPVLEFGYALYLAAMGLFVMAFKKKAWT